MASFSSAVHWAGDHPVTTAVGAFATGAILLLMLRGHGGGNNGMSAFYAAQAAQAASGNQLMAAQDANKTAVAVAGIAADRDKSLATISGGASVQLATINGTIAQSHDAAAVAINSANQTTIQQKQRQDYYLGKGALELQSQRDQQNFAIQVGQQQLEANAQPYLIDLMRQGGDQAALAAHYSDTLASSVYHAAH